MACKDCLQNCPEIISDQCVQYTGPALAAPFNVCTGDQLPVLETALVNAITAATNGTGILPNVSITGCTWIQQMFGILPLNLTNVLQVLINGECSLYTQVTTLATQVASNQNGTVVDTGCLTGLTVNPTTAEIIQAMITLLCSINVTVSAFPSTYIKLADLPGLVTNIVNGVIGSTNYNTRMVPYAAQAYFGPLSNFDSSGIGLASVGFSKVYLCNGQNGTPDLRGRVPVGAIRNVPGGVLDPAVDPTIDPNNPNWGLNDKAGENFHTLSVAEIPAHNHTYTDPGHIHTQTVFQAIGQGGNKPVGFTNVSGEVSGQYSTKTATIGITIAQTGGGQAHNTIQPSIASYYIMFIP